MLVKDEQGKACPEPQKVKVHVCTCEDGVICGKRGANGQPTKSSELGPAGIGLLFLGLLLLLRKFTKLLALVSRCKVECIKVPMKKHWGADSNVKAN